MNIFLLEKEGKAYRPYLSKEHERAPYLRRNKSFMPSISKVSVKRRV